MNPEEMQVNNQNTAQLGDMSADEMAASLALATRLSEDMLRSANPKMNKEEQLPEEELPQMEEDVEGDEVQEESSEEFKEEIRTIIQEEIGSLKDLIKEVLEEEKDDNDDK